MSSKEKISSLTLVPMQKNAKCLWKSMDWKDLIRELAARKPRKNVI